MHEYLPNQKEKKSKKAEEKKYAYYNHKKFVCISNW